MIRKNKEFFTVLTVSVIAMLLGFGLMIQLSKPCAFIFLSVTMLMLILFSFITYKRIKEISRLADYLAMINDGDYDISLEDNKESELSLLKNNIYKVVVKLRSQSELLLKDKTYLADSLADISHQLKTPITSIMMMNDLLKYETDGAKRQEFTDIIDSQLSRMNWLIITLLKLSKLDAGAIEFNNKRTSIKDVISKSVIQFSIGAELKSISIVQDFSDSVYANIDENWFAEAISNIIKNCIEHTECGGEIKITADENPIYTKIKIKDNGSGIDEKDLPHIFERFYQGENHSATSIGIGLALSKAIFNRQGASVDVKSEKNIGTEFEIKIYKTVI